MAAWPLAWWHVVRGPIEVCPVPSCPFLQVFFVDYGNRSHVDLDLLMEIPHQLLELPFQVRR